MYDEYEAMKKNWEKIRYRGGRPEMVFLTITYSQLSRFFGRSKLTVSRWIKEGKLDPTNLQSIMTVYQGMINDHLK